MSKTYQSLDRAVLSAFLLFLSGSGWAQQPAEAECLLCDEAEALIARFSLEEGDAPVRERPNWQRPVKIVTEGGEDAANFLRNVAPDAEIVGVNGPEHAAEHIADADVYFVLWCSEDVIARGVNLRWVHKFAAGVDECVSSPEFAERNILLTNTQRVYAIPIAQHAMALMLALANKLPEYFAEQAVGTWNSFMNFREGSHIELEGKTMFVVGLGGIGTEIARRGHGLGMRVIATRRSSRTGPDFVDYVGLSNEMNELATQAHVVVNALPLTDETRGIFDIEFFNSLPQGALFVNIGRGEHVKDADLISALDSGHLAGAGLDVTDPEPLPDGHPLWDHPSVILTPHVANLSDRTMGRAGIVAIENLRRYVQGQRVLNVVDLNVGY